MREKYEKMWGEIISRYPKSHIVVHEISQEFAVSVEDRIGEPRLMTEYFSSKEEAIKEAHKSLKNLGEY